MRVTYKANNSGGDWWLKDDDWKSLEAAGWTVAWVKANPFYQGEERWLRALAMEASKDFETPGDAMREFEQVTGQRVTDTGCPCCGAPHEFQWGEGAKARYVSGMGCEEYK